MNPDLTRLDPAATVEEILGHIERDGAVIVEGLLDAPIVDRMLEELHPFIQATAPVGDDFAGHQTTRTGGLVLKSAGVRELVLHPTLLGTAEAFLAPFTEKVQLSLTQIIRLLPGQGAQELHRDRFIWGRGLPRSLEPELNSIWALTDFTAENGATRVVPGSQKWDWDREPTEAEVGQAVMPRGSVMLYTGSVIHGGGRNDSDADRIALNVNLANAWLRQEENQYLSCPPERVAEFPPALRALLGYTMANYGLGYFAPTEMLAGAPDTLPPEVLFATAEELDAVAEVPAIDTF